MSISSKLTYGLLAGTFLLTATPALAIGTVKSPNVVKGELELEYFGSTTFDDRKSKKNEQEHEFEIEYGLTDTVGLEFATELERESGDSLHSTKYEAGARFQFFEQGEYWLDSGLQLAYGHAIKDDAADSVKAKLLLEKQFGKFVHRANFSLKQEVGAHSEGGPKREFAWSSRYHYTSAFEPGFEIHSDFGKTSDSKSFDEQEHYIGPAVYGEFPLSRGKTPTALSYEAGYFFGASDDAADGAARVKVEYEMYF